MNILICNEIITHKWSFVAFVISAIFLCCLMLIFGWFLGSRSPTKYKNIPFESGINSVGSARLHLPVKFYLIAMFFVTFDVEAFYLFAWSIFIYDSNWISFITAIIFMLMLLVSLIYLIRIGALDLTCKHIHPIQINQKSLSLIDNIKKRDY